MFAYGLLLNLMPGIFGLFLRLARQLRERAERRRIFCRYAAGAALGLALLGIGYRGAYFGALYYNPWLAAGGGGGDFAAVGGSARIYGFCFVPVR